MPQGSAVHPKSRYIQKLMLNPVQRRPGMRATVAVSEKLVIAAHHETFDLFPVLLNRKAVTAGVVQLLQRTNQRFQLIELGGRFRNYG